MTFSLSNIFVVQNSNTLPTTGSTQNLAPGQFGIFLPDYTPATVGNITNAKYFYLAQGRISPAPGEGSKRSDRIYPANVISWEFGTGQASSSLQITQISNLTIGCNEDLTVTLRLHSMYIDTAYHNGLTRSVMVTTPCCNCGANPCDSLTAIQIQDVMIAVANEINADTILNKFVYAETIGTGASTAININGIPLDEYGLPCDLTAYPYQFDRMYFWTFVRTGPELTTDYEVYDICNPVATVTVLQRSSYPKFVWKEVHQRELDLYAYQATFKAIFKDPGFNGEWQEYANNPVFNFYYLKFHEPTNPSWGNQEPQDEAIELYIPQGQDSGIAAILTAALGAPDNWTDSSGTTTSSTTSSSTTTTTTSYLYP